MSIEDLVAHWAEHKFNDRREEEMLARFRTACRVSVLDSEETTDEATRGLVEDLARERGEVERVLRAQLGAAATDIGAVLYCGLDAESAAAAWEELNRDELFVVAAGSFCCYSVVEGAAVGHALPEKSGTMVPGLVYKTTVPWRNIVFTDLHPAVASAIGLDEQTKRDLKSLAKEVEVLAAWREPLTVNRADIVRRVEPRISPRK